MINNSPSTSSATLSLPLPLPLPTRSLLLRLFLAHLLFMSPSSSSSNSNAANAFSFNIDTTPQQCTNLSISITGSGGTPPYRALVLPFGQSQLSSGVEVRKILDEKFDEGATKISFQLPYPALSQFVVVVSDSQTFGSGGTSGIAAVVNSSDSSCFNPTVGVQPQFFYNLDPNNQIVQCTSSRIWWDPANVTGTPTFYGVIPGGDSFNVTFDRTTTVANEGVGFNWVPSVRSGTTLMLGAGDERGLGAGGSVTYVVAAGNSDSSCLNSSSPSSTAGNPAGGSYPTSTAEAENGGAGNGGGGKSNTGAIVGGVIGGVVALAALGLAWFFLIRGGGAGRRKRGRKGGEKPDLFTENERPDGETPVGGFAEPEPYIVPPPPPLPLTAVGSGPGPASEADSGTTAPGSRYGYGVGTGAAAAAGAGAVGAVGMGAGRSRMSMFSEGGESHGTSAYLRPGTPSEGASTGGASTSRKGGMMPVLRPVNIIQHEDAGPPEPAPPGPPGPEEEDGGAGEVEETVELPPAYTNLRRDT